MKYFVFICIFSFNTASLAQKISVGAGTEFPLGLSLDAVLQPDGYNFYLRGRAGMFLSTYTEAMNSTAESFDFYNSATSDIIAASLKDATFWELNVGWSQEALSGFFTELSYFSVKGQGEVTGATILEAITNVSLPAGSNYYNIEGEVQTLGIRAGYKWAITSNSSFWLSGGVLKPIGSSTNISRDVTGPVQRALLDAANRELDSYMQDTLENDVYIPVLALNWFYHI